MTLIKEIARAFKEDDCPTLAAAVAFYAIFSLPSLLVIVIEISGLFVQPADIEGQVADQIESAIGEKSAEQVLSMSERVQRERTGWVGTIFGLGVLAFGATGVFAKLQTALNNIFDVEPAKKRGRIRKFFLKRLISFAMVLALTSALMVSMVVDAALSALGSKIAGFVPAFESLAVPTTVNMVISWLLAIFFFAALVKWIPDVSLRWSDIWLGASVVGLMLAVGKFLLGIYFSRANVVSAYGAAGSLVLILIWIYASVLVFLLGAEFTATWAKMHGRQFSPEEGAVMTR